MNKQFTMVDGMFTRRGIEWATYIHPITNKRYPGHTSNPIAGCQHGCRWEMPDHKMAICYAEDTAEHGPAKAAYPQGFEHHYYKPDQLQEPRRKKDGCGIFLGSMSDIFAHYVPREQIEAVLDMIRSCPQHVFFTLTKNPKRMLEFPGKLGAPNHLVGASMPPSYFMKKRLNDNQQFRMFATTLETLKELRKRGCKTWVSFEPVAIDVADQLDYFQCPLDWAVIGAASRGNQYFQPDPDIVARLINKLDSYQVPLFYKGNLDWSPWREEFPVLDLQPAN